MQVIQNESVFFSDCDDTLVMWGKTKRGQKVVAVTCPHSGAQFYLGVHTSHVKILKDRKARGSFVAVWSSGGYAWARAVVKALDLTEYVDVVMSKPIAFMDDKPCNQWMGEHVNLPVDSSYGK